MFPPEFVCGFPGSGAMNDWLLEVRWDQIFFTGSPNVGHAIMEAAAKHLTPVVLELGGKSPCIVDETANVKRVAQRVAWGKGINCGRRASRPTTFSCTSAWRTTSCGSWTRASTSITARTSSRATNGRT